MGKVNNDGASNVNSNHSAELISQQGLSDQSKLSKKKVTKHHGTAKFAGEGSKGSANAANNDIENRDQEEIYEYEEDGEVITMGIKPGEDFKSDGKLKSADGQTTDSDSQNSETENDNIQSEGEASSTDETGSESKPEPEPKLTKKQKKKRCNEERRSIEVRLDEFRSTLLAMKDLMKQSGLLENPWELKATTASQPKTKGKNTILSNGVHASSASNSETTIYQNVLEKVILEVSEGHISMEIGDDGNASDPEISFKPRKEIHFSSSSDE